ncbi:hypothetical protein CFC21_038640 [Triticum aestivum]|uniref:Dof zinc finger protein n=1 Tax=Triticum aestivum TaxID=4565 RepID=A0A9R1JRB1_WHEAT|nr:hypothetical protein CFC21_038640 [Triticum aestivum]
MAIMEIDRPRGGALLKRRRLGSPAMIFLPAFLDSSDFWNTDHNQLQLQQIGTSTHSTTTSSPDGPGDGGCNNNNPKGFMATTGADYGVAGGGDDGCGGAGDGDCSRGRNNKSISMSERARLARLPHPVPGLNCPRCESTNTKFCYFNNYSLTQPRHFCRSCSRYWTRGGVLRNVPVGGGYRRHAKRRAKPKVVSATSRASTVGKSSVTPTMSSSTTYATGTDISPPRLQYPIFGSTPSHDSQFSGIFDPANLGLGFPVRLLFAESDAYTVDGCAHHHHHHAHGNGMEQLLEAQNSFPFMHAMDHHMSGLPAEAMPITMATMQGMFHLGLQSVRGGHGDEIAGQQLHYPPAKRNHKHQDYASSRGMHRDVVNGNGTGDYI